VIHSSRIKFVIPEFCSPKHLNFETVRRGFPSAYPGHGLGQAKLEPGQSHSPRPGLRFDKAKAVSGQAKATAFRPSRAGTALSMTMSPLRQFYAVIYLLYCYKPNCGLLSTPVLLMIKLDVIQNLWPALVYHASTCTRSTINGVSDGAQE